MRICLLVEGSYPYIVGGVSAWVQMLISGMPEHEFVIYSVGAEESTRGQFRYALPENVVAVQEVFLDSILNFKCPTAGNYKLTKEEKENLEKIISGEGDIPLDQLLKIFRSGAKKQDPLQIFMSFDFFDVITAAYKKKFPYLPFTDFFWTIRSMLLPLFFLIHHDFPDADVYHSVATGYCGVIGGLAAMAYQKPFILTEHGIYSREREEEIIKCNWAKGDFKSVWIQYFYSLARLAYHNATKVITLFEKNAEVEVALGCDPKKISIIPNGIRVERFATIKQVEKKEGDVITVAAIVRVVPVKDIITMLRSFFLVKQQFKQVRFLIIGPYEEDPEYYIECLKLIENLQIEDVIFTGSVNIMEIMEQVDILVLSSISEGQPLSILEGMASKKPFVATDVGCCRELLYGTGEDDFGEAGRIVSIMDFQGLAEEIIQLACDSKKREQMGRAGYQRTQAHYTFHGFIAAYRKVYQEVYEQGGL